MPLSSIVPIQVRFSDIDSMNHVNNAAYLSYFELARMELFRNSEVVIDWQKTGFILARIELDYLIPVQLNDQVLVQCKISRVGTKSFDIDYELMAGQTKPLKSACRGKSVQVCYNYLNNQSVPIPKEWKKIMLSAS
ncbi:MAG: acyl-CoA thioesterase [Bacteroidia bacterium]|nr:acyl-CoA thioesterase [Bacteroidia bacterium]MCZ2277807.1 acyl-CoA thioesterase [Bacteroidia bacterium]